MPIPASKEYLRNAMHRTRGLLRSQNIRVLEDFLKYKGQIFNYDNNTSYIRISVYPGVDSRKVRKSKKDFDSNSWEYCLSYISKLKGRLFEAKVRPGAEATFTVKASYNIPGYTPNTAMGGKDRDGAIEQYRKVGVVAVQSFVWMALINSELKSLSNGKKRLENILK